jgi:hypothetical protein
MTEQRDDLPEFEAPPITEVVLGIQFNAPANYQSIRAFQVWNLFREAFPVVQEMPPLAAQFETFGLPSSPYNFSFMMGAGAPQNRFGLPPRREIRLSSFNRIDFFTIGGRRAVMSRTPVSKRFYPASEKK